MVRQMLHFCLDNFFRLISPFMPYISEELWQRLPKRASETAPSICVADYPQPDDVTIVLGLFEILNIYFQFAVYRNEELDAVDRKSVITYCKAK